MKPARKRRFATVAILLVTTAVGANWLQPRAEAEPGSRLLATARLFDQQGRQLKAIELYRRVLAVDPDNAEAAARLTELNATKSEAAATAIINVPVVDRPATVVGNGRLRRSVPKRKAADLSGVTERLSAAVSKMQSQLPATTLPPVPKFPNVAAQLRKRSERLGAIGGSPAEATAGDVSEDTGAAETETQPAEDAAQAAGSATAFSRVVKSLTNKGTRLARKQPKRKAFDFSSVRKRSGDALAALKSRAQETVSNKPAADVTVGKESVPEAASQPVAAGPALLEKTKKTLTELKSRVRRSAGQDLDEQVTRPQVAPQVAPQVPVTTTEKVASNPAETIRLAALALQKVSTDATATAVLIDAVSGGPDVEASLAAYLIGKHGQATPEVMTALGRQLAEREGVARVHVAEALLNLDNRHVTATDALIVLVKSPEPEIRMIAAFAMVSAEDKQRQRCLSALMQTLDDKDKNVRTAAALAIGAYGQDAKVAVPSLVKLVQDVDSNTARAAGVALQCVTGPEVDVIKKTSASSAK